MNNYPKSDVNHAGGIHQSQEARGRTRRSGQRVKATILAGITKTLHMNHIEDGIMRKDTKSIKLTDYEKE